MNITINAGKFTNNIPIKFQDVKCKINTSINCNWYICKSKHNIVKCKAYFPFETYKDSHGFTLICILEYDNYKYKASHKLLKTIFGENYKRKTKVCVYELFPNTIIINK